MGGKTYSSVSMTAGNSLCRRGTTALPVTCISNSGHVEPATSSDPANPGSGVTCSDSHVGSSVVLVPYIYEYKMARSSQCYNNVTMDIFSKIFQVIQVKVMGLV